MTAIYRLRAAKQPRPMDPLHVSNIYRDKQRLHRGKMQDRQDLILYLARIHAKASVRAERGARHLIEIPMRLTALKEWVYDYRPALDYFFEVKQLGYYVDEDANSISILVPKDLGLHTYVQTNDFGLHYDPGEPPLEGEVVVSKVYLQRYDRKEVFERLEREGRFDLMELVQWLSQGVGTEFNFIFKKAGKLQQRDTSIWPIAAIETWPSWLREALFGGGIDIDSAYTQYVVQELREIHADSPSMLETCYPDLLALMERKLEWRQELAGVLGLPWNDETHSLIKKICMSLANGSRISPAILTGGRAYSVTAEIIVQAASDVSVESLERIGTRLQKIARQYANARRAICTGALNLSPSRRHQKRVFSSYFEWERQARYAIWQAIECHGIMVHDGIDGVPERYLQRLPEIMQQLGLKVTS